MNNTNNYAIQEDEIDLRELFKTLVKHKIKIVLITLAVTIGAIVYALSKTPIYEVKSNVQVGYIGEDLIVAPETLVKTLNLVFNVEDKPSSKDEFISEVTSISTNKNLKNFIEIKAEGISNEEALKKNKEVVDFIKNSYQPKIKQYIKEAKSSIENTKRDIKSIDDFEIKNIKEQIRILKEHNIVKINEEIKFFKDFKLKTINSKINFHTNKLEEYTKSVNKLYSDIKDAKDTASSTIASIQMVNYQNLILNSQNKIEDLKVEKEIIFTQTIPNLEMKKENISNEQIRKLQHQIDVELESKKIKLNEEIDKLNYKITAQNIRNSEIVGNFITKDYPIKPKKSLIVIVAFVTGLILSIFFVFLLEFIRNEKEQQ
ncbi:MAG: Wzz/FepE/Etk N-terminal domain-containing protein [Sulfurimonas sp.]|uniref:Wzz/FepE/Etk N-terminal domain-containing protein n=1 Tax=Sulfurimonas sp. TaxID=2022749 RepID=UPI0028CD2EAB|nr:Wzz/FepE/Etk N-terminal domain-containing protein [Sulfurimonas sp.]MDT8337603.1 Wzz/FepE/Etk N-terminal domain-containing protein [Sulfurimonas sp.]